MGKTSREKKARKSKRRMPGKKIVKGYTQYNSAYARRAGGTVEKKYLDTSMNHIDVNNLGRVYGDFLSIAAGQGVHQRIGNKVTVVNANFRGDITGWSGAYAGLASQRVRTIWFWDTQANGATPTVSDVLAQTPGDPPTAPTIDSFRNMEQAPRFIILQDKTHVFNHLATGGAAGTMIENTKQVKFSWKGVSPIHYGNSGGELAGIRSNNLCLLIICEVSETGSQFTGTCRVKYTDA